MDLALLTDSRLVASALASVLEQGAAGWGPRAATSLTQLWHREGRREEVRALLALAL